MGRKSTVWFFMSLLPILVCLGIAIAFVSCNTPTDKEGAYSVLGLIPGAENVGSSKCANCHEKQFSEHKYTLHGRIFETSKSPVAAEGCESCHGPGSLHVMSEGDKTKILKGDWRACYQCHSDKKAEFSLQYHHPVPEGRVGCNSCHGSLHSPAEVTRENTKDNNTCFNCHKEMRGPWVFEHEAVQEGCSNCHKVHGSINKKLLTERDFTLCLKCHYQSKYAAEGHYSHRRAMNVTVLGAKYSQCQGCHKAIHGSNFSKEFRTE
ncbi:MAG: hypothetical protein HY606_14785 [Planctomycetes bacterium]|nr:hypothetical protein [Planctomycetota bacterium]